MLKAAYSLIFSKIKKIRGPSLDDNPKTFQEMMLVFDVVQEIKVNGVQKAKLVIDETKLLLRVIETEADKSCPKYIVASNIISHTCLQLVYPVCECISNTSSTSHFEPHKGVELLAKVNDIQNLLESIRGLYMIPDVINFYKEVENKITMVKEQLIAFEPSL